MHAHTSICACTCTHIWWPLVWKCTKCQIVPIWEKDEELLIFCKYYCSLTQSFFTFYPFDKVRRYDEQREQEKKTESNRREGYDIIYYILRPWPWTRFQVLSNLQQYTLWVQGQGRILSLSLCALLSHFFGTMIIGLFHLPLSLTLFKSFKTCKHFKRLKVKRSFLFSSCSPFTSVHVRKIKWNQTKRYAFDVSFQPLPFLHFHCKFHNS